MGQYKVPQNVEAEDKILGPLTFRQFVYALIGFGWGAICFAIFRAIPAVMILVGFPPTMLFMLLAFYQRDGQNFESLLIAMVGFFAAPHQRIWVKEDVITNFRIEPTKKAAEITQRDPKEVMSELEKLSHLIDQRGWNKPPEPESSVARPATPHEDRIAVPPPAPHAPDEPKSDMLDMQGSPLAQNLSELLTKAADDVREEAMSQMAAKAARPPAAPQPSPSVSAVTQPSPGDILKLATQHDYLTVSQVAAQATRLVPQAQPQPQMVPQVQQVPPNAS